ncbi:MAG: type 1 glutamine amidotransferase [Actinomycetota bacterium]
MGPILFIRADHDETFGVAPSALAEIDRAYMVWDAIGGEPAPDLAGVSGVILFGSAFNTEHADEQPFLYAVRDTVRRTITRELPYLGICFGAQALAWALGLSVHRAPEREIGFVPIRRTDATASDPLLGTLVEGDPVFQWHMDTFELPADATLLATNDAVTNQAFRLGKRTWATQFHFEVDRAEIGAWIDGMGHEQLRSEWGRDADELRVEAASLGAAHEERGRRIFQRFSTFADRTGA